MPKKKPKKSPTKGSGWNEASYIQRIKSLEKALKDQKGTGQNVVNLERKVQALEEQLQDAKEALERARPLIQENNRLRSKLRAGEGAAETIVEIVGGLLAERPMQILVPQPQVLKGPFQKPNEPNIGLVHLSDLHMGAVTPSFDSKICADRIRELGRKVTRCLRVHNTAMQVEELHVLLGGDLVEGDQIFPHQAHLIDQEVFAQACFACPEALAEIVAGWASVFPKIKVVGVRGNHGRCGAKHTSSSPKTNWDAVCMKILSMLLKPFENVEIKLSDTFYIVDKIFPEWSILLTHGDQIRGVNGVPWYGTQRKASGWVDSIPEFWNILMAGHFHTPMSVCQSDRWIFGNGTLKSGDEYALSQMAAAGTPSQRLLVVNQKHGPICDLMIRLTSGLQ